MYLLKNKLQNRFYTIYKLGLLCIISLQSVITVASTFNYKDLDNFNLSKAKDALNEYYHSGYYYEQINEVTNKVISYVRFRSETNQTLEEPKKLAIVLDVDETALSNFKAMKKLGFGGTLKEIKQAEEQSKDTAIPEILRLYRVAQKHQVAIFFVTGREASMRQTTIANLKKAGYKQWEALYMKPNHYKFNSMVAFKQATRKKISNMGYDIVANVGDQYSDLKGGYSEMAYKLPNPFYYIG